MQHGAAREIGHELTTTISGNQFATLRPSSEAETVYLVRSLFASRLPAVVDSALLYSFIVYQTGSVPDLSRLRSVFRWNVPDQKLITVTDS